MTSTTPLKVLITAGPTRAPIDSVRFLSNRSSGRLGSEIAKAAQKHGCDTKLLLGRGADANFKNIPVEIIDFETNSDLYQALNDQIEWFDILIMTAAVVDFIPSKIFNNKITKAASNTTLELKPSMDLLENISSKKKTHQFICGFALQEKSKLKKDALNKLKNKNLDAIVANTLDSMESSKIHSPSIYWADGSENKPSKGVAVEKTQFSNWLITQLLNRIKK